MTQTKFPKSYDATFASGSFYASGGFGRPLSSNDPIPLSHVDQAWEAMVPAAEEEPQVWSHSRLFSHTSLAVTLLAKAAILKTF